MEQQFAIVAIFLLLGAIFPIVTFIANWVVAPRKPDQNKLKPYECGYDPIGPSWLQYNVRYYLFALVFVIFDVEVLFMLPWAVVFRSLGFTAFVEMAVFIAILMVGFAYAWKKEALKWE